MLILALTRIPIYLRTARAESAELQSRTFVDAARTFGAKPNAIIVRHVIPVVLPTLLTLATLEFCYVMLAESSLSFLGIGIQPPDVSWGLMVAQGRQYLQTAWWLSIFPGMAIVVTTIAANMLAAWLRIATDPAQRWRLALPPQAAHHPHPGQGGTAVKTVAEQTPAKRPAAAAAGTATVRPKAHEVVLQVRDLARGHPHPPGHRARRQQRGFRGPGRGNPGAARANPAAESP